MAGKASMRMIKSIGGVELMNFTVFDAFGVDVMDCRGGYFEV